MHGTCINMKPTTHSYPWEADSSSAGRKIPRTLWNLKTHYRVHNSLPPAPLLSQMNPAHAFLSHSFKIQLNIVLPSTPRSSTWHISFKFPHEIPARILLLPRM